MNRQQRREIAIHEAGHAVVASLLGCGVDRLCYSAQPGDTLAVCELEPGPPGPVQSIAVKLAGRLAEETILGVPSQGDGVDRRGIDAILAEAPPGRRGQLLAEARGLAETIIAKRSKIVQALAGKLLSGGDLRGAWIGRLVQNLSRLQDRMR